MSMEDWTYPPRRSRVITTFVEDWDRMVKSLKKKETEADRHEAEEEEDDGE